MVSTLKVRWSAIAALGALAGCGGPAAPAEDARVAVAEVAFQQDLDRQGKFTNTDKCNDPSAW